LKAKKNTSNVGKFGEVLKANSKGTNKADFNIGVNQALARSKPSKKESK